MASRVTPPAEDEGAKVDGVVEAGGVVISVQRPPRSKLCLAPSNGSSVYGTHHEEMRRNGKRNRKMVKKPCNSRRKNELIMGRHIPTDIYEG